MITQRRNIRKLLPFLLCLLLLLLTGCQFFFDPPVNPPESDSGTSESASEGSAAKPPVVTEFEIPDSMIFTDKTTTVGTQVQISDFVTGIPEGITVEFLVQPDTTVAGSYTVILLVHSETQTLTKPVTLHLFGVKPELKLDISQTSFNKLSPLDFLDSMNVSIQNLEAIFVDFDPADIQPGVAANYSVHLRINGLDFISTVIVTDITPPTATVKSLETLCGVLPSPQDFIDVITDYSQIASIEYETVPDVSVSGKSAVRIVITDTFGNKGVIIAQLNVLADEEAPVISGAKDIFIPVGDTISYKSGVTVTDNSGGDIQLQVDSSLVDRYKAGVYPVTYTATDATGNIATVEIKVYVDELTEKLMNSFCDYVISRIITDDMTLDEKIERIWLYSKQTIKYVGTSNKTDIYHGAYAGFKSGVGDCYTYYCVNVLLLNRLGIPNVEVRRANGKTNHWWNLVQFEDGLWYHVDSCLGPNAIAHEKTCKMTDDDLVRYTEIVGQGRNYYGYDNTLPQYEGLTIATDALVEQMKNESQNPSNPTDPGTPADPAEPVTPTDPVDSSNPNPTDPADPATSTDPDDPENITGGENTGEP